MPRDIDQQVDFLKSLDDAGEHDGDNLEGGRGDGGLGDEDAGVEVVGGDMLGEGAHLLDADGGVGGEFDPDGADGGGLRGGVMGGGRGDGVFDQHCFGGFGLEGHFAAAAFIRDVLLRFRQE